MKLIRASERDCDRLWSMQREAFRGLLEKYRDYDISPGGESRERVMAKLTDPHTYFYFMVSGEETVGAVRVVDKKDGSRKRVSPIFVMERFRGRGMAQRAFAEIERIHGGDNWKLDTILQEEGNCYLYEKLGYRKTGVAENINDRMDIVYYEKN